MKDEEKVDCLRRISAKNLMDVQCAFELSKSLIFTGPQYDGLIFPEKDYKKSLMNWNVSFIFF